jgi:hypothetical protein
VAKKASSTTLEASIAALDVPALAKKASTLTLFRLPPGRQSLIAGTFRVVVDATSAAADTPATPSTLLVPSPAENASTSTSARA